MNRKLACLFVALAVAAGLVAVRAQEPDPDATLAKADKLFEQKNYKEAAQAYETLLKAAPRHEKWIHASERTILCRLRLRLFDDALAAAETFITRCKDTPYEARAERLTGNLYLTVPHWGTRAGGKFHRAKWMQGLRVRSFKHDKKKALAHMERARELYAKYDDPKALAALPEAERENWHNERVECLFDLAGICGRFGIYENQWFFWYYWWGERDDFLAETAGEDDFDEYHSFWQQRRKRPIGLRLDAKGQPVFPTAAKSYSPKLSDDQKLLFLLDEARRLDTTKERRYVGLSYYRQAMLARARFGMDRLNTCCGLYYWNGQYPLKEELKSFTPWELEDSEAIVLAGGRIRKVTLPKQWNVLGLLRTVGGDYRDSGMADEAQYAVGVYHQSRQQYLTALAQYDKLATTFPKSKRLSAAKSQTQRIKQPQVHINRAGVQLPAEPARLQLGYRNTSKVWFVARSLDAAGFIDHMHGLKELPHRYAYHAGLNQWHQAFVQYYNSDYYKWRHEIAVKYIGKEVARWSDAVKDDGTHRFAEATNQTPLKNGGAYLVYAYLNEPPKEDADKTGIPLLKLGSSRAVCALTDLALVEKKAKAGNLYFVTDARTGTPIPDAKINVLHFWNQYDSKTKKHTYRREVLHVQTGKDGTGVLYIPEKRYGQLHAIARTADGRLAWSGMSYWSRYHPSSIRDGLYAYCITDRPVYRPGQRVRYKVWLRRSEKGVYHNEPNHRLTVRIVDVRGNQVHQVDEHTDQHGGIDGELTLGDEPPLGVYRLQVRDGRYVGGQNFRVEEYKKPEFEVAVEPGKTHTRLGDKVAAVVKATYYFGGPVTDATVKYKVFREEYVHGYTFPGRWDWLYGPGYGWVWYEYPWFGWWHAYRWRCWSPPIWWWGWYGGARHNPVRELVQQGSARIGKDGTLKVDIDTKPALRDHPDRDHRYVVQAEVRDASRRVITGEGAVKVTRQAYYAFIQSENGYVRPGQEMRIRVRCLTPDNKPVKAEGVVTVSSVQFGGRGNAKIEEKELKRWKAATDERGHLVFQLRHERSGQLRIKFTAPDQWGGVVEGHALVWVCGEDFDGKLYRFNNLELITDKRTYQPGDTAHVLINTKHANSYVLFSDDVDNSHLISWKVLHLPNKTRVVDIPITRERKPNFFVEATTVADTRVHQQIRRLCVPPADGVIDVTVAADKPEYKPGEKATVKVTAKTPDGEPAQAQVCLSAFDKSVLYIQSEYTPPIAKFFHGRLRNHRMHMATNLVEQFSSAGYVHRPFHSLHPLPDAWWGIWGPSVDAWHSVTDEELRDMTGGWASGGAKAEYAKRKSASGPAPAGEAAAKDALSSRSDANGLADKAGNRAKGQAAQGAGFAEAEVRTKFADTACWRTTLTTDADGVATASFDMPENLTTWKINAWGITPKTRVGQADTAAVTTKNLLVRLQAPRFFLEYDEVVVSANVHNYLAKDKTARVSLAVPAKLLKLIGDTPATVDVKVAADGERRIDWRVKVLQEGTAKIAVKALTDEESDAMQMAFPVLVHGITKQIATTGSMRPQDAKGTAMVEIAIPEKRRPELSRLEVQFAPSLVGAMLDALPYCIHYPYGCTEQTMSRFLPAVLTLKTLQNMGIKLDDVRKIRGRLAEVRRIEKGERRAYYADNPIFDQGQLDKMIADGLSRITNMQHGDGSWGWWRKSSPSPYLTSYVLYALCTAQQCDVTVNANTINRGMNYLRNWGVRELREHWHEEWRPHAQQAFAAYVLSLKKLKATWQPPKNSKHPSDFIEWLFAERDHLPLYGKALLSMALANLGDEPRARLVLRNVMQYLERNDETQVAWFRTPRAYWWYWWNSDIETNATCLRAIVRLEPKSPVAPRLVKWLLNNRRNGYYWRSTRDTTLCVAAMSDFVAATGEGRPDYTLTLDFDDGAVTKTVKIDKDNFFTYDNRFVLEGVALGTGKHALKITKDGPGALYFNTYLRYFTKEEHIAAAGHELKVGRSYFKLEQIPYAVAVEGSEGQKLSERRLRYKRVPVKNGDTVKSGDTIQVELRVTSDNDYTYLCFEDMKPAGCEPTQLRSGGKGQEGFYSYMELRDEKTVFFISALGRGEHLLRYRLRAEVPGVFHALPTVLYGMYAPELRANSHEHLIKIID